MTLSWDVEKNLRDFIKTKIREVSIARFHQEPAYVTALLAKLDGYTYKGFSGQRISINSTIVNDRGPNSAEKKYGADFAITVSIQSGKSLINKAVLGQAKKGCTINLSSNGKIALNNQINKMATVTKDYVVLEIPENLEGSLNILASNSGGSGPFRDSVGLEGYIISQLLGCHHGDRRKSFIDAVQHSDLSNLSIAVAT